MKRVNELVIFIVGPYRAKTPNAERANIEAAAATAFETWMTGVGAVICPHINCRQAWDGPIPTERILEGDKLLLSKCDAVRVTDSDYGASLGSVDELVLAKQLGIPVLYSKNQIYDWLEDFRNEERAKRSTSSEDQCGDIPDSDRHIEEVSPLWDEKESVSDINSTASQLD